MRQWSSPQNSAHLPSKEPTVVGVTSIALSTPWMRSRFCRNAGTQKEWLTSTVFRTSRVVSPTGSTSVGCSPASLVPVIVTSRSG